MASSDDEGEAVPQSVTNYHFVDDKDEPVSFSILPIEWGGGGGESPDGMKMQIFLHGTADSGLQKIYKQVTAWKFELSDEQPEISVLSKENNWIKLQKPRKSFEDTIRTILITVYCLHFVKRSPETSGKSLWDHLRKVFSLYEARPSENDLLDHLPLISEAVKRDETLTKSMFLLTFLEEKPRKKKIFDEDVQTGLDAKMSKFIVDDDDEEGDESDEETELFDSVCAICDNGGELLCCEGRCMRSFHATEDAGAESVCDSLGLSEDQVEAIQNFYCLNCQHKRHQCFSCGKLGSSDKSSGAEVFPCVSATCGHFYHPECVVKLLHPGNRAAAEQHQKKIASGESFTCPVHKCLVCNHGENKMVHELQFAVCRRCPKAYHRKCLPRKIAFEDLEEEDIVQRAWDGLIPNRILIYCLKHKMDEEIGTPVRDHILFPGDEGRRRKLHLELQSGKKKFATKKRSLGSEDSPRERIALKTPKQVGKPSAVKEGDSIKKSKTNFSGQGFDSSKKLKTADASRKSLKDNIKYFSAKVGMSSAADGSKVSFREDKLSSLFSKGSEPEKSKQKDTFSNKLEKTVTAKPVMKKSSSSLPLLDAETERRIVSLMKDSTSSITLEEIVERHKVPSTHAYSSKSVVDKTITQGRVEGSVEAVRTALQKLEEGCSIEDAKAVCEPEILNQIIKWKNKLKVYLAPFLHGMRYTSFGRHFTKVDKLKEIVDKLHCYVQNGDMIVDFCCGANDFSCLMKEKLEETGKKCSFKNYDVIQPKNDFNFEKRDWMSVRQKELPTGSQLIMGLNPPFGVKAALANKFIDKALEFKPKLLILIVPKETERLDEKEAAYDLVWEDNEKLSGKSFYLPGSVDVNDKQMDQWNVKPPLLYLWSRPDWTARHKIIAQKHGHTSKGQKMLPVEENHNETKASDHPTEVANDYYGEISKAIEDPFEQKNEKEETEVMKAIAPKEQKESSLPNISDREGRKNHGSRKKRSREIPQERQDKGKLARGKVETPPKDEQNGGRPAQVSEMFNGTPPLVSSPFNRTDPGILLEGHPSEVLETPSARAASEENFWRFQPNISGSGSHFGTGYGGNRTSIPDDIARRYGLNSEDPFAGGTHKWPTGTSLAHDYGVRGMEEQFPGMESFGRKSYIDELDEKYRREAEMRLHLPPYGRPDTGTGALSHRSSYLPGQDSGFSQLGSLPSTHYGHLGLGADSSYNRMNSSTMQRYAPRLDELNHTRTNPLTPETPLMGRSGIYDTPGSRPGIRTDSLGFAPGPQHPFSHQNSSGWLNE